MGRLSETSLSPGIARAITSAYIRAYGVDMGDVDADTYRTFDAFFTRALREGARANDQVPLVSPADGMLTSSGVVDPDAKIQVKGQPYDVAELVGDAALAASFIGGSFAVIYLSPRDYHRVHCPVDGRLTLARGISGDLYPVNSIGEKHVPNLFVKNQRVSLTIETPTMGKVVAVMVGAMIVGKITVTAIQANETPLGIYRFEPALDVKRGDELGMFHLGSTVVLFTGRGTPITRRHGAVRCGQSLVSP
ncbi:MAG TPA: archaetidylserine decarboxylase [Polyangiaceae bacterium]|jgi:phosphatidylserine decarboxylase|nr:archaetidylserine decarboxylase [Polyangiaceae bacterium]